MTQPKFVYTLRAGSYVEAPYMTACFPQYPENCTNPGIDIANLVRVLNNVGIGVKLFEFEEEQLVEAIYNGTIDMMAQSENVKSNAFGNYCVPTSFVSVERPAFYTRNLGTSTSQFSMLTIFGWKVWMVCLCCFFIAQFSSELLGFARSKLHRRAPPSKRFVILSSGQLVQCMAFLVLGTLLNVYANILAIGLANKAEVDNIRFSTLAELAQLWYNGECKIMTYDYLVYEMASVFPTEFHADHSELDSLLYEARIRHPPIFVDVDDYVEFIDWIVHNESCLVHVDYETRRHTFSAMAGKALSVIIDEDGQQEPYVYYYSPFLNDTLRELLAMAFGAGSAVDNYEKTIETMVNTGILVPNSKGNATVNVLHSDGVMPLAFAHFWMPFLLLAILMLVSLLVLAGEKGYFWMPCRAAGTEKQEKPEQKTTLAKWASFLKFPTKLGRKMSKYATNSGGQLPQRQRAQRIPRPVSAITVFGK